MSKPKRRAAVHACAFCSVCPRQKEKSKVEAEMRLVLKAMDAQKAAASRNIAQLSKIYYDWSSTL